MCGIVGVYHYGELSRPVDRKELQRMTDRLSHRGPDASELLIEGPLGLGHRRLAIVDLSPTGRQPMSTDDGAAVIAYNGEFYDHLTVRDRLVSKGLSFRGSSDTETLLKLLRAEGADALAGIAAIFGLAYWDSRERVLLLARDPLGVKQLYYHDNGSRIAFASEIKALLECSSVPRAIDLAGVNEYLHFHTTLFDRTFFDGIRQVKAGEYLTVGPTGTRRRTYWQIEEFGTRAGTSDEHSRALREQLGFVIPQQLMSDVPTGAFFSGGIDSSAVAAFAARSGTRLPCFGVHFSGQGVIDERPYQEAAARAIGLDLHLITLDGKSFPDDFPRLVYVQDQPVLGAAMFPMDAVSRLAAEHVTVCLGGQGADELFGGYARYSLTQPWQVARSAAFANGTSHAAPQRVRGNLWKQVVDLGNIRRLSRSLRYVGDWTRRYFENFAKVPERAWRRLISADGAVARHVAFGAFAETVDRSPAVHPADKAMHWDLQTYLTGLFHQDDRISMQWSLESRVPLADPRLARFAFATPFDMKVRSGASKWLLRTAVADVLPPMVLNRRKVGFDTPAESWMRDQHRDFLRDQLLSQAARERGIWNVAEVERLLSSPKEPLWFDRVWKALNIEQWAQVYLDRRPADSQVGS